MLSSTRFVTRVLRVAPVSGRSFSDTSPSKVFDGSKPDHHVTREKDNINVQYDAAKEGKAERASGEGSAAASEKDKDKKNKKAQEDYPEAHEVVIGMNDERGGVSFIQIFNAN